MGIVKFTKASKGEQIKCIYLSFGPIRITFALAEQIWKNKHAKRHYPIRMNRKGLFVYRLAIRINQMNK